MKFKVGDKVVVQKRIDGNSQMQDLAGEVVTITEVDRVHEIYLIREDEESNIWPEESFERLATEEEIHRQYMFEKLGALESNAKIPVSADPLAKKIEERNHKPIPTMQSDPEELSEQLKRVFPEDDPIKPKHYENNGKDLFDELYDRLYHSKKMFTGREVFIIVMKFVAERYTRRYPNKNAEDLSKGIYCLQRLKEYEELEE